MGAELNLEKVGYHPGQKLSFRLSVVSSQSSVAKHITYPLLRTTDH
jgi:hypothetical protein